MPASGHADRGSTQFRILAFTREWDYPRPHSRSRGPLKEPDMSLRVMSADSHMDLIYLPPDTFTARMPSTWRDRAPQVVERDGRKVWVSGNAVLGPWGVCLPGVNGVGRRGDQAHAGVASGMLSRLSRPLGRRVDHGRIAVDATL